MGQRSRGTGTRATGYRGWRKAARAAWTGSLIAIGAFLLQSCSWVGDTEGELASPAQARDGATSDQPSAPAAVQGEAEEPGLSGSAWYAPWTWFGEGQGADAGHDSLEAVQRARDDAEGAARAVQVAQDRATVALARAQEAVGKAAGADGGAGASASLEAARIALTEAAEAERAARFASERAAVAAEAAGLAEEAAAEAGRAAERPLEAARRANAAAEGAARATLETASAARAVARQATAGLEQDQVARLRLESEAGQVSAQGPQASLLQASARSPAENGRTDPTSPLGAVGALSILTGRFPVEHVGARQLAQREAGSDSDLIKSGPAFDAEAPPQAVEEETAQGERGEPQAPLAADDGEEGGAAESGRVTAEAATAADHPATPPADALQTPLLAEAPAMAEGRSAETAAVEPKADASDSEPDPVTEAIRKAEAAAQAEAEARELARAARLKATQAAQEAKAAATEAASAEQRARAARRQAETAASADKAAAEAEAENLENLAEQARAKADELQALAETTADEAEAAVEAAVEARRQARALAREAASAKAEAEALRAWKEAKLPAADNPDLALRVEFPESGAALSDEAQAALMGLAEKLRETEQQPIEIRAYWSAEEDGVARSKRISLKRGMAVRQILNDYGVFSTRIVLKRLRPEEAGSPTIDVMRSAR